jgi:L-ascorbate metabolism protein UlaG (beta-lactamase superfamily)
VWALGQAGFVLKGARTIAYIDPYLSCANGHPRRFPPPVRPDEIHHADIVFGTHDHRDHVDAQTLGPILHASTHAIVVTTAPARETLVELGVSADRILVPRVGEAVHHVGPTYTPVPAAHYEYSVDEDAHSSALGFVISCNGVTVYHAGDTVLVPEILDHLRTPAIEVAFLPFNGRDYFRERRNTVGNLLPREAVQFAAEIQANVLVGMHNDLFDHNRINTGQLFDEVDARSPRQRCHVLQPGELYLYAG